MKTQIVALGLVLGVAGILSYLVSGIIINVFGITWWSVPGSQIVAFGIGRLVGKLYCETWTNKKGP